MGSATTVAGYLFAHRRLRGAGGGGAGKSERRVPRHAAGSSPGPARHDHYEAGADAARPLGHDEAGVSRGPRIYRDRAEFAREARARLAARRRDSQGV